MPGGSGKPREGPDAPGRRSRAIGPGRKSRRGGSGPGIGARFGGRVQVIAVALQGEVGLAVGGQDRGCDGRGAVLGDAGAGIRLEKGPGASHAGGSTVEEDQSAKFIHRMFSHAARDRIAILAVPRSAGNAEQRVATLAQASSPKYLAWLRH